MDMDIRTITGLLIYQTKQKRKIMEQFELVSIDWNGKDA